MLDDPKKKILAAMLEGPPTEGQDRLVGLLCHAQWKDAPDLDCPVCGKSLQIYKHALSGPYAGHLRCTSCSYRNSVIQHLGKSMFSVQKMPSGVIPVYDKASGEGNED